MVFLLVGRQIPAGKRIGPAWYANSNRFAGEVNPRFIGKSASRAPVFRLFAIEANRGTYRPERA